MNGRSLGREFRRALAMVSLALVPQHVCAQSVDTPTPPVEAPLDPESPMAPMADIGVAWPEMGAPDAGAAPSATAQIDETAERRYLVVIEGLDQINAEALQARFNLLSTLKAGEDKPANNAQIDRRAREDEALLAAILRAAGHYDAEIESNVAVDLDGRLRVVMAVAPGPLYRFSEVKVEGLDKGGSIAEALRPEFGVEAGSAVDADAALAGQAQLERKLKGAGYPFAKVREPEVVVDHEKQSAALVLPVDTGGARRFGSIIITGENPPFDAKHVGHIARFSAGQPYDQAMVDDLRRALIATGVAGAVDVTPVPGTEDGADIKVAMEPAKLRTIAGEAGYGTGEGVRLELSWTHRNLIKPEGAVTLRGVAGTREQALGAVLQQSNFHARDRVLNARIGASHLNRPAFDARTFELGASLERQSNIIWQKRWTWSVGGELIATDERDMTRTLNQRATYFVGALPMSLGYDRSNDLLDPTRGFRLSARISPEASLRSGTNLYVRSQIDASAYLPAGKRVTIAGRVRLGSILGSKRIGIAPSRRFYAGGGGSVRGFGYQGLGPRDAANDPIGGRSLAEFALEARIRWKDFGIVPFVDGGNVYTKPGPDFSGFRYGAGIGLRYHSSFGPVRIDLGTPINPRKGDSPVTVFVSLGQAF